MEYKVWLKLIQWQMNGNCDSELELLDGNLLYLLRLAKFSAQKPLKPISTSCFPFTMFSLPVEIKARENVVKIIENTALFPKLPVITCHKCTPYQLKMHIVGSLAHNIQSPNPNVLSRALVIIYNCSMKKNNITAVKHSFNFRVGWHY